MNKLKSTLLAGIIMVSGGAMADLKAWEITSYCKTGAFSKSAEVYVLAVNANGVVVPMIFKVNGVLYEIGKVYDNSFPTGGQYGRFIGSTEIEAVVNNGSTAFLYRWGHLDGKLWTYNEDGIDYISNCSSEAHWIEP